MNQYDHGFVLFELGYLVGQVASSVERGAATPHAAVDLIAMKMKPLGLSHKEKVILSKKIWERLKHAEGLCDQKAVVQRSGQEASA